jgi:hypothetical protein
MEGFMKDGSYHKFQAVFLHVRKKITIILASYWLMYTLHIEINIQLGEKQLNISAERKQEAHIQLMTTFKFSPP